MKTLKEMLAEARAVVPEEGPADLQRRLAAGEPVTVIDVRDPDEHREGYIEPATNVSRGFLEFRIGSVAPDATTPIVLYCQTGLRSMLSAKALKDLGYSNVVNLQGGFQRWVQSGLPVVKDATMGTEQLQRYSRHFLLAQVGEKGQRKLLRSKVLLIGAGGLGSPTALYLAAAGVGTIGLMDGDVVDITNLQRQILHTTADVGKPKVESGMRTLRALNPDVKVVAIPERITADNALELIADYDVVVDGSDNFGTRYLVNDACYLAGKPQVHGSIFQFEGMASVFAPNQGPCYRCLYPTPPPPGPGALVRGGGRAGRAAGDDRPGAGDRDDQAAARPRRAAGGSPAHLRRARHALPRGAAAPRPGLPAVRRGAEHQGSVQPLERRRPLL